MKWYVEHRPFTTSAMHMLAWDIARHLYTRRLEGPVLIVTPEPFSLLRVVRKQWLKLIRTVQRERSKTLQIGRIKELSDGLQQMQALHFTSKLAEHQGADVLFVTPEQLTEFTTRCHTGYIVSAFDDDLAGNLDKHIPKNGVVVAYEPFEQT